MRQKRELVPQEHTIAWILAVLEQTKVLLKAQRNNTGDYCGLCSTFGMALSKVLPGYDLFKRGRIHSSLVAIMRRHCVPSTPESVFLWGVPSAKNLPLRLKAVDTLIEKVKEGDISPTAKKSYKPNFKK